MLSSSRASVVRPQCSRIQICSQAQSSSTRRSACRSAARDQSCRISKASAKRSCAFAQVSARRASFEASGQSVSSAHCEGVPQVRPVTRVQLSDPLPDRAHPLWRAEQDRRRRGHDSAPSVRHRRARRRARGPSPEPETADRSRPVERAHFPTRNRNTISRASSGSASAVRTAISRGKPDGAHAHMADSRRCLRRHPVCGWFPPTRAMSWLAASSGTGAAERPRQILPRRES